MIEGKYQELVHSWEEGQGEPLLLLHGGLSNGKLAWRRTAEALAAYHRVITLDRRGHGQSPSAPKYTIESDARDVLQIIDHLELEKVHLVGHSYGAVVALQVASARSEAVRSLHLIEPPLLTLAADDPRVEPLLAASVALWQRAEQLSAEEVATQFLTAVAGAEFVEMARSWPVWPELVAEARRLPYEENPAEIDSTFLDGFPSDLSVSIYTGGRSHPALQVVAESLVERVPGARLLRFPDGYHEVHKLGDPFIKSLLAVTRKLP